MTGSRPRARQLLLLVRPTVRSADWRAPVASGALAVVVGALTSGVSPTLRLEFAAVALALGASSALDDPAADSLAASPAPVALRHAVRAGCALPLPAAIWLLLVLRSHGIDRGTLTLELAGLLASALALGAVGARVGARGGTAAGPALLGLVTAAALSPASMSRPLPWAMVLAVAGAAGAAASRDPATQVWRQYQTRKA
jgi:hypothetical protein